jgi:Mn2+/Fe2+ NRAMP family transporter
MTTRALAAARPLRSRKASRAFGLAFAGALLGAFIFPMLFSLAAIVQGVRGRREIKRNPELKGKRLATAAIVIGSLGFLFWALLLLAGFAAAVGAGGANTLA